MCDAMSFPATVEEFMEQYKIVDCDHVYSNGMEFVPIFRMKQWFEHEANHNDEVSKMEIVHCYECKHNPKKEWFGCPMAHLNSIQRPEDAWCWRGEREAE